MESGKGRLQSQKRSWRTGTLNKGRRCLAGSNEAALGVGTAACLAAPDTARWHGKTVISPRWHKFPTIECWTVRTLISNGGKLLTTPPPPPRPPSFPCCLSCLFLSSRIQTHESWCCSAGGGSPSSIDDCLLLNVIAPFSIHPALFALVRFLIPYEQVKVKMVGGSPVNQHHCT